MMAIVGSVEADLPFMTLRHPDISYVHIQINIFLIIKVQKVLAHHLQHLPHT